jgi:pimeloyl-ACP methyl ester carboxylesterase
MTDVKPEADTILAAGVRLHGFPYDIHAYAEVAPVLAAAGCRVIVPYLRGFGDTRFLSADTAPLGPQSVHRLPGAGRINMG